MHTIISRDALDSRLNLAFPARMRRAAPSFQAARRMTEVLGLWFGRHQERKQMRRELPTLTPEQLRDLDLTHKQAEELANKPFWRE